MLTATQLQKALDLAADPTYARGLQRFFKTAKGEYGEGDIFIGLKVPMLRRITARYRSLPLEQIEVVLESPVHEHRLAAVIIMADQAKMAQPKQQKALFELYLRRTDRLNNWDIIDASCPRVVGAYLQDKPKDVLFTLARSSNFWERRIAMVSTAWFIRAGQLDDAFAIATVLLNDQHDLIHKAVGWMLREAGKKDEAALKQFLDAHAGTMPRTTLRYSLERLNEVDKAYYMNRNNFGVQ